MFLAPCFVGVTVHILRFRLVQRRDLLSQLLQVGVQGGRIHGLDVRHLRKF